MFEALAFLSALVLCLVLIRLLNGVCLRYQHVDHPGGRKQHRAPTPLSGGFAIGLTFLLVGAATVFSRDYAGLALGLMLLAGIGAADDVRHIPAALRLGGQALAVVIGMVLLGGIKLAALGALLGTGPIVFDSLAVPFTIVAVVGLLNSINMIDGVDGLAGGFSLLVFAVLAGAGYLVGGVALTSLSILIGAVIAFLAFNMRLPWRRRAAVFLGDAGSLILGFALAWFAVAFSQGQSPILRPITMVWLFGLPLADTGYLMLARAIRNGSPMRADRRHFHHLLQRLGLSPGQTCWAWLAVAALFMLAGLAGQWAGIHDAAMFYGFWAVFTVYCLVNMVLWSRIANAAPATQST